MINYTDNNEDKIECPEVTRPFTCIIRGCGNIGEVGEAFTLIPNTEEDNKKSFFATYKSITIVKCNKCGHKFRRLNY